MNEDRKPAAPVVFNLISAKIGCHFLTTSRCSIKNLTIPKIYLFHLAPNAKAKVQSRDPRVVEQAA